MIKKRQSLFVIIAILGIILTFYYIKFHANKTKIGNDRRLVVYSYSSFAQSWSAGPEIAKDFEKECNCKVELLDVGESGIIIQRLKLSEAPVDVVIGLEDRKSVV